MSYFCDLHDDHYYIAVKFENKECSICHKTHEHDHKLACKKCQNQPKIDYNQVPSKIDNQQASLKSALNLLNDCINLAHDHFQDEKDFYHQTGLDIKNYKNQIMQLEETYAKLKQRITFVLQLMQIEGFKHSDKELEEFTDFRNSLAGPHYINEFSKILQELSIYNCAITKMMNFIQSFVSVFQSNQYIQHIRSVKLQGKDILYTLSNPVRVYIGTRIGKVRQGQGIETYNSEAESGSQEGYWQNDQLIEGIRIIKGKDQYIYYEGHWQIDSKHVKQQEWDKDRSFQRGIKKITDLQNNVKITYKGEWSGEQFQQGTLVIEKDDKTKIYDGIWDDDVFYIGNHKIIDKQSKEIIEHTGEWKNGDLNGLKSISNPQSETIYEGLWQQSDFCNGTKEVTNKVTNNKIKSNYTQGKEEQLIMLQNPYSDWIFVGTLTDNYEYLSGKLYNRMNQNNFYIGTFQGQNEKLEGSEYVNNKLIYRGTYKNDKYQGDGILFQSDGTTQQIYYLISYKGTFVNGALHGLAQRIRATINNQISENDQILDQKDSKHMYL